MRGRRTFMSIKRNISSRGKCRSPQMQLSPNSCLKFRWWQKHCFETNPMLQMLPLKCSALQIQHHCVVCLALRCWNRTWRIFLLSTWGLLKSWRSKASSSLNVLARPEILKLRISKVMTFRVSVLYWDELRYQYISSTALSVNICTSRYT